MKSKEKENTSILDPEFFESRKQVGEDFVEKLMAIFYQEAPKLINNIRNEARNGISQDLAGLGHKMKGMCLNVGATYLSEMGKKLEEKCSQNSFQEINELIDEMEDVFKRTKIEMERILTKS